MNHKPKVNTEKTRLQEHIAAPQRNGATFALDHTETDTGPARDTGPLRRRDIDMQAADIEAQALAAQTLCEICFEEIDNYGGSSKPDIVRTMGRLDALLKAVYRNAVLVQESADAIAALVREGGAA